jgi:hypothetical protein
VFRSQPRLSPKYNLFAIYSILRNELLSVNEQRLQGNKCVASAARSYSSVARVHPKWTKYMPIMQGIVHSDQLKITLDNFSPSW